MGKKDELDRRRVGAYAWGCIPPDEDGPPKVKAAAKEDRACPPSKDPVADDDGINVSQASANHYQDAARTCEVLANSIDRAWALPEAEQAAAIAPLLFCAKDLGIHALAFRKHSRASARLMRLVVRCRAGLAPDALAAARGVALWLDYRHVEVVDLLVEVALAGDKQLAGSIERNFSKSRGEALTSGAPRS